MQEQIRTETTSSISVSKAQKYILFRLAGEIYGLLLVQLQEILETSEYTQTPNMQEDFHGVVSIRGEIIPVLNLRRRFGYSVAEQTRQSRVIIVDLQPSPLGIQVDEIIRVISIRKDQIKPAPELTSGHRSPYVTGVSERDDGKLIILLDMQKVLNSLEQSRLSETTKKIETQTPAPKAQ
ncbi:chemotaxis protein CheW, partial [Myxococcota bacterium]|nr:chemotaxis protein CheW [Myxococcota bacterium]